MTGRIVIGRDQRGDVDVDTDVVICGGGAGGCMAARELSRAGVSVAVLEEGGDRLPEDFDQREDHMLPELFQELGGQRSSDMAIVILSGRGLGGSTIHNQNLCKRTPDEVLEQWVDEHGLDDATPRSMAPVFAEVERDLGVVPISDAQVNAHNSVVARGRRALGYAGGRLSHNRDDQCTGSGFCELGCAYDGKLNARRVLVPQALEAGAAFYTDCRVDRIRHTGGRATGVEATLLGANGSSRGSLRARARAVCLAGSAIGSAALALRSGLPDPHVTLGKGLRIHPASIIAGIFPERIEAWRGIPQSEDCTELLDFRPGSDRRVWLVPSFAHPVGAASMMPGFGPGLVDRMRDYPHLAVVAAMVHDETSGRVRIEDGRVRIDYAPIGSDREQLALGAREGARLLLAAGARQCVVPAEPPIRVRYEGELEAITAARFVPHDGRITAVHPMGTMAMGADPRRSVTDARGKYHHLENLHVVDGSLFPTSIGGPPQISVYAFSMMVARHVADALR